MILAHVCLNAVNYLNIPINPLNPREELWHSLVHTILSRQDITMLNNTEDTGSLPVLIIPYGSYDYAH
ncbi:MAG: hypothetical protein HQ474_09285 [Flammeovirgaceae bacterium]|nr:hypothetical protein [Flammeovirgaceae bacterium]